MGRFKHFLNKNKPLKIGFATIDPKDDTDRILRKPKLQIGFATIDLKDDSDKLLGPKHSRRPIKEDTETQVENPYERAVHERERHYDMGQKQEREIPEIPGYKTKKRISDIDAEEFPHHHELNLIHHNDTSKHGLNPTSFIKNSPIHEYTQTSRELNRHLIRKHIGKPLPDEGPDAEKSIGYSYTLPSTETINRLEQHHRALAAETHHPGNALKHPTVVHSGAGTHMAHILHETPVGEKIHFPAYTSTSTQQGNAHRFSQTITGKSGRDENHIMHFHLPQGYTKGRHVANISDLPSEHEMILHHGQTFQKVHHHMDQSIGLDTHHHHFIPSEED